MSAANIWTIYHAGENYYKLTTPRRRHECKKPPAFVCGSTACADASQHLTLCACIYGRYVCSCLVLFLACRDVFITNGGPHCIICLKKQDRE